MAKPGRRVNVQHTEWLIARGAGFTAFLLLTASVTAGLALSLRLRSPRWPAVITKGLHQHLTTLSLWMLGLHVGMLIIDGKSGVPPLAAAIPFRSDYRPWAVAVGVLGTYAVLTLIISTKLKGRIGHARWRRLHYLAFLAYGAALLHGLLAGTDTGTTWASAMYFGSAILVGGLTITRITGRTTAAVPARPTPAGSGLPPLQPRR